MGDPMDSPMKGAAMLPCDQVIAKLWEYLDGALPDPQSARIREHLAQCARCYPQYDFDRAFLALLQRTRTQSVPPALRQRVLNALLEEQLRGDGNTTDDASVWVGITQRIRALFRRR